MSANDFLLSWPRTIDISANTAKPIDVISTEFAHRVRMDVSASRLNLDLSWRRRTDDTAPFGSWKNPAALFTHLAGKDVSDLDIMIDLSKNSLDFTTQKLNVNFKNGTANDYVIPYVLYRLFKTSSVDSGSVPTYSKLTENNPLLKDDVWAKAYYMDISKNPTAVNTMFSELLLDTNRFSVLTAVQRAALYSPDPWADSNNRDVSGGWMLQNGDVIQFTTKFTFANRITVKNTSTINPDNNDVPVKIILPGESYYIRFQLRAV